MTSSAAIREAVRRVRGSVDARRAVFLAEDRRVLAADGGPDEEGWRALLREAEARWERWHAFEREDAFTRGDGVFVVAHWMAPHGVLLVEIRRPITLGLARLRMKRALEALESALVAGVDDEDDDE